MKKDRNVTRTRGYLLEWSDNSYKMFVPTGRRDAAQQKTLLCATRNGKFYRNEGLQQSSYSIHCNVPTSVDDPTVALLTAAVELFKLWREDR